MDSFFGIVFILILGNVINHFITISSISLKQKRNISYFLLTFVMILIFISNHSIMNKLLFFLAALSVDIHYNEYEKKLKIWIVLGIAILYLILLLLDYGNYIDLTWY